MGAYKISATKITTAVVWACLFTLNTAPAMGQTASETDSVILLQAKDANAEARRLAAKGRLAEAEPLYREALKVRRETLGFQHPDTLITALGLASLLARTSRGAEADPLFLAATVGLEKALGKNHHETLVAINELALFYAEMGRFVDAESLFRKALEGRRTTSGPGHRETLTVMSNLASVLVDQNKYLEANELYNNLLQIQSETSGVADGETQATMKSLISLYDKAGNSTASSQLKEVITQNPIKADPRSPSARLAEYSSIASEATSLGHFVLANDALLNALTIAIREYGDGSFRAAEVYGNLAANLVRSRKYDEADSLLLKTIRLNTRLYGSNAPDTLTARQNYAYYKGALGKYGEAIKLMEEIAKDKERAFGENNADTRLSRLLLANLLGENGHRSEAIAIYRKYIPLAVEAEGMLSSTVVNAKFAFGIYLSLEGFHSEAEQILSGPYPSLSTARAERTEDFINNAFALAGSRLRDPKRKSAALEVAQEALFVQDASLLQTFGEATRSNDLQRQLLALKKRYRMIADAAWSAKRSSSARITPEDIAYNSLQKSVISPAGIAVMAEREREAASVTSPGDEENVAARQLIAAQLIEVDDQIYRLISSETTDIRQLSPLASRRGELLSRSKALNRERGDIISESTRVSGFDMAAKLIAPPTQAELTQTLRSNEALLFIIPSEYGTHVFAFSREGHKWFRSTMNRDAVADAVKTLRKDLDGSAGQNDPFPSFNRTLAHQLYNELILPVASELRGKTEVLSPSMVRSPHFRFRC